MSAHRMLKIMPKIMVKETGRHNCMFFEKSVKRPLSLNKGTAQKEQLQ